MNIEKLLKEAIIKDNERTSKTDALLRRRDKLNNELNIINNELNEECRTYVPMGQSEVDLVLDKYISYIKSTLEIKEY